MSRHIALIVPAFFIACSSTDPEPVAAEGVAGGSTITANASGSGATSGGGGAGGVSQTNTCAGLTCGECHACAETQACSAQWAACEAVETCFPLAECQEECVLGGQGEGGAGDDRACLAQCHAEFGAGQDALAGLTSCFTGACGSACNDGETE